MTWLRAATWALVLATAAACTDGLTDTPGDPAADELVERKKHPFGIDESFPNTVETLSGGCYPDRAPPADWSYFQSYSGTLSRNETFDLELQFCVGSDGLLPNWSVDGSYYGELATAVLIDPNGGEYPLYTWDRNGSQADRVRDSNSLGTGVPLRSLSASLQAAVVGEPGTWTLRFAANGRTVTFNYLTVQVASECGLVNLAVPPEQCQQ